MLNAILLLDSIVNLINQEYELVMNAQSDKLPSISVLTQGRIPFKVNLSAIYKNNIT